MSEEIKNYFIISLIACIIGAPLVFLSEFAWYYNYGYYVESWGSIYFSLEYPIPAILIGLVTLGLFFGAYISYLGMQGLVTESQLKSAVMSVSLSLGIVVVGGLVFLIVMLSEDLSDWGFSTGFYGGLISSVVALFFLNKAKTTIKKG